MALATFPITLASAITGGPAFSTTVIRGANGQEVRNANWQDALWRFNATSTIRTKTDADTLYAFFLNRYGREDPFLLQDPGDFAISSFQSIGTGDGADTTFQIVKKYTDSAGNIFTRNVYRPSATASDLVVKVNNVTQTNPTNYSYSSTTGIITFVSAPGNGLDIAITLARFYVYARFDADEFPNEILMWDGSTYTLNQLPAMPILEVRP